MRTYERADVPSNHYPRYRKYLKRGVARARRQDGKRRLEDAPTSPRAYIRGWAS